MNAPHNRASGCLGNRGKSSSSVSIDAEASASLVANGEATTLTFAIQGRGSASGSETLVVQSSVDAGVTWTTLTSVVTDDQGVGTTMVSPTEDTLYRATLSSSALGASIVSQRVAVEVIGSAMACALPVTVGPLPTATDCLFILGAAVGLGACSPACACAPAGTLPVVATDALFCLAAAVGSIDDYLCPCPDLR